MVIKNIKTVGFRKFEKEFKTDLYPISYITGKNTSGKTNVLYAIIWAFLGSNLTGDERVWLGNSKAENCYVEINFIDNNGKKHTLVRSKNKYNNTKNFILIDNKEVKQEDLVSFYSDKKLFLSILNPNYFTSKKPAEQKELLDRYLPQIDIHLVYEKLDDEEKKILEGVPEDITQYMSDLRADKKLNEDRIKNLRGKIEYAESIVNTELEEKKQFEKNEELTLAMQELSFLNSENNRSDRDRQLETVNSLEKELIQMETNIRKLSNEMSEGKKKYLVVKNSIKSYCPTCEQEIKDDARNKTITKMRDDLEKAYYEKIDLEKDVLELKTKLNTEKCKLYAIKDNTQIKNRMTEVDLQIKRLEQEKSEIEKFNSSIDFKTKNIEDAKKDIESYENMISQHYKNINNIERAIKIIQKLYINYIEEKMKVATEHLKDVRIKYYSVLKESGELKDDFIITYNGNEFKNLSKSETIATALELSNMLNKVSGVNLPLFIDDSESCADYDFLNQYSKDTQILIAKVNKGAELQITEDVVQNESLLQAA